MGLLDWLFGGGAPATGKEDDALIALATEHVVKAVDPRLKLVSGYEKKLRDPIETAIAHCRAFGSKVPPAAPVSSETWGTDPTVCAMFATATDVPQIFSRSPELQDFFASAPGTDHAFAALTATRSVEKSFGMRAQGEVLQRDVAQTTVSFSKHQVTIPSVGEDEVRREIMRRVFRFLATQALRQISSAKIRREDLKLRRSFLRTRLDLLQRQRAGLESVLDDPKDTVGKLEEIETQLNENERELSELPTGDQTLDYVMKRVKAVLMHPADHMDIHPVTMRLNRMNIVVPDGSPEPASEVCLPEVSVRAKPRFVLLLARFPRSELLARTSMADEAQRLLG